MVGQRLALLQEGAVFHSQYGPFSVDFTCSRCAYIGFLRVLLFPPTVKNTSVTLVHRVAARVTIVTSTILGQHVVSQMQVFVNTL